MSKVWKTTEGKIALNSNNKVFVCDACPCGHCGAYATSYTYEHPPFVSSTVVTLTSLPIAGCPKYTDDTKCYWSGIVSGGVFAGNLLVISGLAGGWLVEANDGTCFGLDSGTQSGATPAGTYSNGGVAT